MSLAARLSNLHLLLHVPSFARWPLELRFFCRVVYETWIKQSATGRTPVPKSINVTCDFRLRETGSRNEAEANADSNSSTGGDLASGQAVQAIDPTFRPIKQHVKIGQALMNQQEQLRCVCCEENVDLTREMIVVCPEQTCQAVSHMACLSNEFLESGGNQDVVPVQGECPSCKKILNWVDLVKELTLRMRGEKEIKRLMKHTKRKITAQQAQLGLLSDDEDEDFDADDPEDDLSAEDVIDEPHKYGKDRLHEGDWETSSVSSLASASSIVHGGDKRYAASARAGPDMSIVIEDSDDIEIAE